MKASDRRRLGRVELDVTVLSLGTVAIGNLFKATSDAEASATVDAAWDHGIRYFDTAWVYSAGQSEERVGLVAKNRRDEMWIATKARDRTRDGAREQLETGLKRLQTSYVDEWRIHNVSTFEELDECLGKGGVIEAMTQAKDEGLVKHIEAELASPHVTVIATGGLAPAIAKHTPVIQEIAPNLTLEGMRIIWERNQNQAPAG